MTQRDRPPPCLRGRQVASYLVVEAKLALLFEEHDCGRSELLADGSGLEDAVRGHGYLVLKVCKAVSLGHHDLAVLDDSDGHSGDLLSRHLRRDKSVHRQHRIARRRRRTVTKYAHEEKAGVNEIVRHDRLCCPLCSYRAQNSLSWFSAHWGGWPLE